MIKEIFESYGFKLSEKEINSFEIYKTLLMDWNKVINLTSITDDREIIIKHFIDSYSICKKLFEDKKIKTVLDMGTGAGFPGVIAGILYPNIDFTLVDSVNKKVTFVEEVVEALNLKNVFPKHHRLTAGNPSKKTYDVVFSRAFMKPKKLVHFAKKYVAKDGFHTMLLTQNQIESFSEEIKRYSPEIIKYPYEGKDRYILKFARK